MQPTSPPPAPANDADSDTPGPRCPVGDQESYAWGFMIGYLGKVPDTMTEAFKGHLLEDDAPTDTWGSESIPTFFENPQESHEFTRGYEAGVTVYTDHAYPEDREE